MTASLQYDRIVKYVVTAVCIEPLHIGNADGSHEEVLVHPVDGMPFVQASGIAGVLRDHGRRILGEDHTESLFGASHRDNEKDTASRTRFTDGIFEKDGKGIKMELRPRLSIDAASGTCDFSVVSGTSRKSGHKFNMEYIGSGAEFKFAVYVYIEPEKDDMEADMEKIFAAVNGRGIQLGGQKSNGCGFIEIKTLKKAVFDMRRADDREKWMREEDIEDNIYEDITDILPVSSAASEAYEITVTGRTEGELLVKGIAVMSEEEVVPDAVNMRNANGDYIIPGSSVKGAFRNQMEKIAGYLGVEDVIGNTFGLMADTDDRSKCGNITFFDTVVGNQMENDLAETSYRIHLDKFTGGVISGGLFSEKNAAGELEIKVHIADRNAPEKTCAVLLLALRDLATGIMNLGSGYSIGKGIVQVKDICIRDCKNDREAKLDYQNDRIIDAGGLIEDILASVQKGGIDHGIQG